MPHKGSCGPAQVAVSTLDVAEAGEAREAVALAQGMAPLGGLFHLAMVLRDQWLSKQVGTAMVIWPLSTPMKATSRAAIHPRSALSRSVCWGMYGWMLFGFLPAPAGDAVCFCRRLQRLSELHGFPTAQTAEDWQTVQSGKAHGALNLDAACSGIATLDAFVIFSSVVSSIGNEGAPLCLFWV